MAQTRAFCPPWLAGGARSEYPRGMVSFAAGPVRTALFDFDGTLADSLYEMLAIYNELAAELKVVTVGPERAEELRKLGAQAVIRELGIPMWKVPRVLKAVRSAQHARKQVAAPFAGILASLERLQQSGVQTGVVSSNSEPNVRAFFVRHGCTPPAILSTGVGLFGKGSRLKRVLAHHGLSAREVAYVGDEVRDIEASRTAGVRSVAVSWGYGEKNALLAARPDALVDAPDELVTALSA